VLPSRGIAVPTLVIRGQGDRYLGRRLAQPEHNDVPARPARAQRRAEPRPRHRVVRLANASHWVHHNEAERVNELLVYFFNRA
jgi:pimeloyl-ACP methyl ester carboxylesterase